jgi:putative Ig domain-containing protein
MRRFAIGVAIGALCAGCGESAPSPANGAADASGGFGEAAMNRAPIIESLRLEPAEPAQGAVVSAVVMARDADGQPVSLTHRWFVDGGERLGEDGPSLALDGVAKGAEIRVSVTATDGTLTSDTADASARVIDRPPSITRTLLTPPDSVAPGQPVTATAGAADADGDPIDYEYTWFVNGERRSDTGSVFATDGLKRGDSIYAEVRASDGSSWTDPTRTPVVTVGSAHPDITSTPPGLREDGEFRYQVVAVDPDGDKRLRYSLEKGPAGMAIDDVSGKLVWRPGDVQQGVHPVTVVVRDSGGLETKQSFSVTVKQETGEAPVPAARKPE